MKISPPSTISGVFSATSICVTVDHRHVIFEIFRIKCHAPRNPRPTPAKTRTRTKTDTKTKNKQNPYDRTKTKTDMGDATRTSVPSADGGGGVLDLCQKGPGLRIVFHQISTVCFLINLLNPAEV